MPDTDLTAKLHRYQAALDGLIERLQEDRWVLAAVLVGSLNEETIWRKEGIGLWIVEADGVTRRRHSDGDEPRIWRTLVEQDVNLWCELIPRARFKQMVEGSARTSFSYNFFATRTLVYSTDEGITRWFEQANTLALRDQKHELLMTTGWVAHSLRHTRRLLDLKEDLPLAWQSALEVAHALAAVHVVQRSEICETPAIYRALADNPGFFNTVYTALLTPGISEYIIRTALETGEAWLDEHGEAHCEPVLRYLRQQHRAVPLSELADQFAFTQLYPWHLEAACEWLVRTRRADKLAADLLLTKRSRTPVEEPAYFIDAA